MLLTQVSERYDVLEVDIYIINKQFIVYIISYVPASNPKTPGLTKVIPHCSESREVGNMTRKRENLFFPLWKQYFTQSRFIELCINFFEDTPPKIRDVDREYSQQFLFGKTLHMKWWQVDDTMSFIQYSRCCSSLQAVDSQAKECLCSLTLPLSHQTYLNTGIRYVPDRMCDDTTK